MVDQFLLTKFNAIILVLVVILGLFLVYGQDMLSQIASRQSTVPQGVRLGEAVLLLPLAVLPIIIFYVTKKGSHQMGILTVVIGGLMVTSSVIFLWIRETPFDSVNTQGGISISFLILLATGSYILTLGLKKIQR